MFDAARESLIVFILCVVLLIAMFCLFIISLVYKYQERKIYLLAQMDELRNEHQNSLLEAQVEIQEQAFGYIAREIHDNVSQKLTLAKLYLNTLPPNANEEANTNVENAIQLISASLIELSDLSKSMSNDLVANYGLTKVIELEVEQVLRSGMFAVHIATEGNEVLLDTAKEVVLYRIFQEALNNIIKHAKATVINIRLIYYDNSFEMQVEDDGIGFDSSASHLGTGMNNIRKRTAYLNGNSTVLSNDKGTLVTIKIPLDATNKAA